MTKIIYKPELMKRLFKLLCEYSSVELSLTKILGQLSDAGNVTTLANYITTLDESRMLWAYKNMHAIMPESIILFLNF